MTLDDVSEDSFWERQEDYRKQTGMYDLPVLERQELADHADKQVVQEMLSEIHTMLLHLTKEARGQ